MKPLLERRIAGDYALCAPRTGVPRASDFQVGRRAGGIERGADAAGVMVTRLRGEDGGVYFHYGGLGQDRRKGAPAAVFERNEERRKDQALEVLVVVKSRRASSWVEAWTSSQRNNYIIILEVDRQHM